MAATFNTAEVGMPRGRSNSQKTEYAQTKLLFSPPTHGGGEEALKRRNRTNSRDFSAVVVVHPLGVLTRVLSVAVRPHLSLHCWYVMMNVWTCPTTVLLLTGMKSDGWL